MTRLTVGTAGGLLLLCSALLPGGAAGQRAVGPGEPESAVLVGVVRDSLSGRPLPGARLLLGDALTRITTDGRGRFRIEMRPGEHTLAFSHRDVPSWSALTHPVTVTLEAGDTVSVVLAGASEPTALDRTCGPDARVVGGVVRDLLTLAPLPAANVHVWAGESGARRPVATLRTSPDGEYQSCVPPGVHEVEIQASLDGENSRPVRLAMEGRRVVGRELYVRASEPVQLQGHVVDGTTDRPVGDAEVEVVGTRLRALTDSDGSFRMRSVPPGTVRMAVERLGYGRRETDLLAVGGDTLEVRLEVYPEAIALDSMVVEVTGRRRPARERQAARFDGMDRSEIERLLPRVYQFNDLLRNTNVPGLRVREVFYQDRNGFRRPGTCVEIGRRSTYRSDMCQMVAVYLNDVRVSDPESFLRELDPNAVERFQLISPLEATGRFAGVRVRNGVLLIYTRGH